jgi:hypothetical protein
MVIGCKRDPILPLKIPESGSVAIADVEVNAQMTAVII